MRYLVPLLVILLGCAHAPTEANTTGSAAEKPTVVVTMYPLEEFARAVGGDRITVYNVLPVGAEPHSWQPRARDLARMDAADLVVMNGAGFEAWADEALAATRPDHVLRAAAAVELRHADTDAGGKHRDDERADSHEGHAEDGMHDTGEEHGEGHEVHGNESEMHAGGHDHAHGAVDPHLWLNPKNDQRIVTAIAEELAAIDPRGAQTYRANAEAYNRKLQQLDESYEERLEGCRRDLVVNHAAFGYLAEAYGLEQLSIFGLSHDDEPTPRELAELQDVVEEHNVTTVYAEELVSPAVAETLARDVGLVVRTLNPAPSLTEEQVEKGTSFIDVMYENLEALEAGLC